MKDRLITPLVGTDRDCGAPYGVPDGVPDGLAGERGGSWTVLDFRAQEAQGTGGGWRNILRMDATTS